MVVFKIIDFHENNKVKVIFEGSWNMRSKVPDANVVFQSLCPLVEGRTVEFDLAKLDFWDTSFASFVSEFLKKCEKSNVKVDITSLPKGTLNIINFSKFEGKPQTFQPEKNKTPRFANFLAIKFFTILRLIRSNVEFIGEAIIEIFGVLFGKSKFAHREFSILIEEVGVNALAIVALISFLVGLILAFVSIIQLNKFGAGIYCADLVGISMMREMGCLMTAIIMSGRTGAAFAATIGAMVVNEEIDAMRTSGLSCFRFIILPRIFALTLMMPLLCIFSDVIGIAGGMFAAVTMLNMNFVQYLTQTNLAISLGDILCGLIKSIVFAILVSGVGCLRGMQCGRNAESVGKVTTSAVVTSITGIIITDAIFAIVFNALRI